MPFVYIVRCADGTFYTGWTTDLARRVIAHNAGRGGRYTRAAPPRDPGLFGRGARPAGCNAA